MFALYKPNNTPNRYFTVRIVQANKAGSYLPVSAPDADVAVSIIYNYLAFTQPDRLKTVNSITARPALYKIRPFDFVIRGK